MDNVSVAEAKKHFSDLMAQVAYTGRRIVVERHGSPMMAWVSLSDLQQLERSEKWNEDRRARRDAALALATDSRRQIQMERKGEPLPDSVDDLHALREMRLDELAGLR